MSHARCLSILLLPCLTLVLQAGEAVLKYPSTKRGDTVDVYHGTKVADPYRWLEGNAKFEKDVKEWIDAENKVTFDYLAAIPERDRIKKRLTELWDFEKYSAPFKVADSYYVFSKNDGLQNHAVFYTQKTLTSEPQLLLDPNTFSKDGTVSLAGISFSEDGKHLAYGISESGSDWQSWNVMKVDGRKILDDDLTWIKYSGPSPSGWTHDSKGFFYSRFPETKDKMSEAASLNMKLYYHVVGTKQADDKLIYERPDQPKWSMGGDVTDDGRNLIITLDDGTTSGKTRIAYKDLKEPGGKVIDLIDKHDAENSFVASDGPVFFFKTDKNAPRGKIVAVDKGEPTKWKDVVPEATSTIESVSFVGNMFVCIYMKDAHSQVEIYKKDGQKVRSVELPGIGTASGFSGKPAQTETFYSFVSFATPLRVYRYDLTTGMSELFRQPKVKFNPDDYEVKQVFYKSKDGTKVPMFISHKKGIKLDGSNPTLLYGYGGFNISLTPWFGGGKFAWMEMGGVLAVPNIRGGGEYGREWHRAATVLNRPKAYEDFIAAAEYLISEKYTQTPKLAIQGGSNGGLLVGAVMCKRPDLFGACLPGVGVMDMLRFHKMPDSGRFWTDDFGSSDVPEEFKVLYSYSPYHNLKPGTKYPATLVTTADSDDRVVPAHSFKFTAELQKCQAGPAPVLIRVETRAGHGAGRPTSMMIEEIADEWAFLVRNLKMKI